MDGSGNCAKTPNSGIRARRVHGRFRGAGAIRRQRDAPPHRQLLDQHPPPLAGHREAADDCIHGNEHVVALNRAILKRNVRCGTEEPEADAQARQIQQQQQGRRERDDGLPPVRCGTEEPVGGDQRDHNESGPRQTRATVCKSDNDDRYACEPCESRRTAQQRVVHGLKPQIKSLTPSRSSQSSR